MKSRFNQATFLSNLKFFDSANFSKTNFLEEFQMKNISFFSKSYFFKIKSEKAIFFNNVTFGDYVNFKYSKLTIIKLDNTKFNEEVDFAKVQFRKKTIFFDVQFSSIAEFSDGKFYGQVDFRLAQFRGKTCFNRTQFVGEVYFDLRGVNLIFDLSDLSLTEDTKVKIEALKTCRLILNDVSNSSESFLLYDTEIITLKDYEIYANRRELKLNEKILKEIKNKPNLEIVNSHLNQMKFINCDFSKAKHIKIESSDLTEVKFLATDLGNISEKRVCSDLFKENPKKARDVYRQLKLTLDNHKDYFSANGFYALEMKAQEKVLEKMLGLSKNKEDKEEKEDRGRDNLFRDLKVLGKLILKFKKLPKEKYELLVLKIHKLASNFGQSWIKPLIWIAVFGLLFTGIRFAYMENIPYKFFPDNINRIFDAIATVLNEFTKSLIPIFSNKKEIEGLEFVSLLFSIIIAFLTYQFIVAVRRKVKR